MKKATLIRAGAIYLLCIAVLLTAFSFFAEVMLRLSNSIAVVQQYGQISVYIGALPAIGYILIAVGASGKRRGLLAASIACAASALIRLVMYQPTALMLLLSLAVPIFYLVIARPLKPVWRTIAICLAILSAASAAQSAYMLFFANTIPGRENVGQMVAMLGIIGRVLGVAQTALSVALMVAVAIAPIERLLPETDPRAVA